MAIQTLKTYDLKEVYLIIGGLNISGYGEGGAIEFEPAEDIGNMTIGNDGSPVFSRNNNDLITCTITLLETSKSYKDLATLLNAQQKQLQILPMPFLMQDAINGDEVSDEYAVFTQRPMPSKGKSVGDRQFQLALPNAAEQIVHGANNVL